MWFSVRDYASFTARGSSLSSVGEDLVTPLQHGSVWVWLEEDDHSGVKHLVTYPPAHLRSSEDEHCGTGRWTIIARWMTKEGLYADTYPYRRLD